MKTKMLLCASFLLATLFANATVTLVVGTPGNSQLSTPTGPTKISQTLINFDSLTPFSTFDPGTYAAQGVTSISSPDGLLVIPYSTQSDPNELYDTSSDGSADITIDLNHGATGIGIGIADSDPVSITLQALDMNGNPFGSAFTIDLATTESTINTGNGYYILKDPSSDIYGLEILQTSGSVNYSGLAIDDLQIAPEPASLSLLVTGLFGLGAFRLRKRA